MGARRAKYGRIWSVLSSVSFGVVSRNHHDSFCILRVSGVNSVGISSEVGGAAIRVVTERVLVDFRAIGQDLNSESDCGTRERRHGPG